MEGRRAQGLKSASYVFNPDGVLQIVATPPLKYLPRLDDIPEPGDPLRLPTGGPVQAMPL